jgi:hypothetical protein
MMAYVFVLLLGLAGGAICVYVLLEQRHRQVRELQKQVESEARHNERTAQELKEKQKHLDSETSRLQREAAAFNARVISLNELQNENAVLKRDLRNLHIGFRKLELDRNAQRDSQRQLDERSQELAQRYLKDNLRWINSLLNQNNYTICKQRLLDVIARCRGIGFDVTADREAELLADLQAAFEKAVRIALEREEQARIKAQIREEHRLERETEREIQQAEQEKKAIQEALDRALREAHDHHSAEIQALQAKLAEAEARSERAISMAQLTKTGHVYVISNIGSFGENVFKVGMTRRLEPLDRVRELGDASVPFPFDVHMMISCDDAPSLENALHVELRRHSINRINPRKEFFRIDIETIRVLVEKYHGVVDYVADPEALQYRESLTISEEDQDFIESVYDAAEPEGGDEALDEEVA